MELAGCHLRSHSSPRPPTPLNAWSPSFTGLCASNEIGHHFIHWSIRDILVGPGASDFTRDLTLRPCRSRHLGWKGSFLTGRLAFQSSAIKPKRDMENRPMSKTSLHVPQHFPKPGSPGFQSPCTTYGFPLDTPVSTARVESRVETTARAPVPVARQPWT